jgi:hypothetical protein
MPEQPTFDPHSDIHARLVTLAGEGEAVAASVDLDTDSGFQAARRQIREALAEAGLAQLLDKAVADLLAG